MHSLARPATCQNQIVGKKNLISETSDLWFAKILSQAFAYQYKTKTSLARMMCKISGTNNHFFHRREPFPGKVIQ